MNIYILHGWAVDQFNDKKWQPFMEEVKKNGHNSIFLKIPGLSSPLNEVWELDDFVKWVGNQLPKNEKIVLLGHSFGGQIAIRFTANNPDRVEKLILIDSAGQVDNRLRKVLKRNVFWLVAKIGKLFFNLTSYNESPSLRSAPFQKGGLFLRRLLYKFAREGDYKNAPPLMRKVMANVIKEEVIGDAKKIKCKNLIVWGSNDMTTPLFMGKKYQSLIKRSKLKIINEARHSPQFTHVNETVSAVKEFIND